MAGKQAHKSGESDLEWIRRQLRRLANGKANDCVRLAMGEEVDIESLDLTLLTEIKRSEKGVVEIKLVDRMKVLEQLAAMAGEGNSQAEEFLQAILQANDTQNA